MYPAYTIGIRFLPVLAIDRKPSILNVITSATICIQCHDIALAKVSRTELEAAAARVFKARKENATGPVILLQGIQEHV